MVLLLVALERWHRNIRTLRYLGQCEQLFFVVGHAMGLLCLGMQVFGAVSGSGEVSAQSVEPIHGSFEWTFHEPLCNWLSPFATFFTGMPVTFTSRISANLLQ